MSASEQDQITESEEKVSPESPTPTNADVREVVPTPETSVQPEPSEFRKEGPVDREFFGELIGVLTVLLILAVIASTVGRDKIRTWLSGRAGQRVNDKPSIDTIRLSPKTMLHKVSTDESVVYVAESSVNIAIHTEKKSVVENPKHEDASLDSEVDD